VSFTKIDILKMCPRPVCVVIFGCKREGDNMGKITSWKVFIIQDIHHTQLGLSDQEYKMGGVCSIHRSDEIVRRFFRNLEGMRPLGGTRLRFGG
jgi:hypothetical protein